MLDLKQSAELTEHRRAANGERDGEGWTGGLM